MAFRSLCTKVASKLRAERLTQRNLVLVQGPESSQFLQGLITNDMGHLSRGNAAIYTMFLNKGGRVLYDSIIYRKADDSFLVEIDLSLTDQLVKHLKVFRLRRKIDIEPVAGKQVWAVWQGNGEGRNLLKVPSAEVACADPRLKNLGNRIILEADKGLKNIEEMCESDAEEADFREYRYQLGIGEGVVDFPKEKGFPLEGNLDFLNGVSFNKGCYVGQELTARTYHTGVVRKRLMPLQFKESFDAVTTELQILNEKGANIGKLRGYCNGYGLGLLRIEPSLAATKLTVAGSFHEVTVHKPKWWPTDQTLKS